jgi:16S rRNA (adenine(1408)-N(1))-methyltransferase
VPAELRGIADELTIAFPWGSLLTGTLARDERASRGIAGLVRPGGGVVAHVSIAARDRLDLVAPDEDVADLARRWRRYGLELCGVRLASPRAVAAMGSSWARRLATDPTRPIWRLDLERGRDLSDPGVVDDASSGRR